MDDLHYRTVAESAALVRGGDASPRELVTAALERIARVDPQLRAFVDADAERALAEADAVLPGSERPFAGVPFAVKANVPVAGRPLTMGSALLRDHRADHDAFLVSRLRRAGFVVVGMTNLAEFGILPTTEPRHGGPTRNPWDRARTPGGSSGGSAAAVAAGLVPAAHGNDGGGSLRIPAACCGLVGLKPSRGRISQGPGSGGSLLAVEGVLTRTVADTAALLDVLSGYEVGDAVWAPRSAEPYLAAMSRDPGRLRVAVTSRNYLDVEVAPAVEATLRAVAGRLEALGHEVVEATPPLPDAAMLDLFLTVFGPQVATGIAAAEELAGRPAAHDDIEPLSQAVLERAAAVPSHRYLAAVAALQGLARRVVAFFGGYDLLLTPTLARSPLPMGELHGCGADPLDDLRRSGRFAPFTALFNVTGQPAVSVPAGTDGDGLPTAIQLVGRPLAEETLLQVAAQLESAHPWPLLAPFD
ncbi:MAG: Aspartyl-tRNA(Asn) amidotransferase subunit A @ Glutamyl-tRNA(Gln) amidotransferase subunit A [uncultured Solirubrobacteraceae bacterium]|uniref:Aspartyl-tRNA(Asn) amidotransferase subunit A @ Glutamyl-tRNA(Gln) amidotransferase subunit A n=1 Tax=uncultured Solirubrobacteraceae bacterium TaxID=1162706 RepID=A0A6J4RDN9_9ACTN|nr:MAG: Aspartyl-tRNA(Asn) amidotransferase subunit A @ Glutamyl-tRNA(Gln) amidotransferase subunit A [uncultured Solirubrobacteraceae bacterium]